MPLALLGLLKPLLDPRVLVGIAAAGALLFAGLKVQGYMHHAEAAQAQVIAQQKQIADLATAVQDERKSVDAATQAMTSYENAVAQYAQDQAAIKQQVAGVRHKLDTSPILQKAQTNAQGADTDLNNGYADMLSMFDGATAGAASASGGSHHPSQAPAPSP